MKIADLPFRASSLVHELAAKGDHLPYKGHLDEADIANMLHHFEAKVGSREFQKLWTAVERHHNAMVTSAG